jgi:hypothetical protein
MADDFVDDLVKKKIFKGDGAEKRKGVAERRDPNARGASMRGPDRRRPTAKQSPLFAQKGKANPASIQAERRTGRSAWPKAMEESVIKTQPGATVSGRRLGHRTGGRRHTDFRATPRLVDRDLRVAATSGIGNAAERGSIVSTPVIRPRASTIGDSGGILSRAAKRPGKIGMLAKIATAALGGYAAAKAWKDQ